MRRGDKFLSRSWEGRIFIADKATRGHGFSTAHGAYDSGLRAADEVLAALQPCELLSLRG
ncbi:FAD-dependent oxidoreductase [Rhizobium leguminosarum]|uniref:FAD-dependent oxidoreductase n=1 Tax=Rhizobium TaxID=379 RepID=UPI003965690E